MVGFTAGSGRATNRATRGTLVAMNAAPSGPDLRAGSSVEETTSVRVAPPEPALGRIRSWWRTRYRPPRRLKFTPRRKGVHRHHPRRRLRRHQHRQQPPVPAARHAARAHHRQRHDERAVAARSHRGAAPTGPRAGRAAAPRGDRGLQPQEARALVRHRGGGSARRAARGQALLLPQDQPDVRAGRRLPAHAA